MNILFRSGRLAALMAPLIGVVAPFALAASLAQAVPGLPELGLPYGNHFAVMKAKLNLNAAQEAQYTVAMRATQKAMQQVRKARTASAEAAKAELAKADPDFARLLSLRETALASTAGDRSAANAEWVKFTQLLSTEQKGMIRSQLLDRVSRAEALREKFRQRHGG